MNLAPMTSIEALALFHANGRNPFSFLHAPYGVLKTLVASPFNGRVIAWLPSTVLHDVLRDERRLGANLADWRGTRAL